MLLNYHIGRFVLVSLCVEELVRLGLSSIRVAACNTDTTLLQHTAKQEQNDQCGNLTA